MAFNFGKKRFLNTCTAICSGIGLLLLLASISTDYWLTTHERRNMQNGTEITENSSGLWRKCTRTKIMLFPKSVTHWTDEMRHFPKNIPLNCTYLKYFQKRSKAFSDLKPTEIVLFEMQPSAIFPIISLVFLSIACSCALLNQTCFQIEKMIMIAGANFVISGLALLIGIVLYVGSVSQSFDSSSNSINTESKYLYAYDVSFHLTVISFILMKLSGIVSLYHYIAISKHNIRIQMTSQTNLNKLKCSNLISFPSNGESFAKTESCDFSDKKPMLMGNSLNFPGNHSPIFRTNTNISHFLSASDHTLANENRYMNIDFDARIYEDSWGAYDNHLINKVADFSCHRHNSPQYFQNHIESQLKEKLKFHPIKCSNSLFSLSQNETCGKLQPVFYNLQPTKRKITLV